MLFNYSLTSLTKFWPKFESCQNNFKKIQKIVHICVTNLGKFHPSRMNGSPVPCISTSLSNFWQKFEEEQQGKERLYKLGQWWLGKRCRRGQRQQGSKADQEQQGPARSSKARAGEEQYKRAGERSGARVQSFLCVMFGSNRYKGIIVLCFVHLSCLLFIKFVFVLISGKISKSKQKSVTRSITK